MTGGALGIVTASSRVGGLMVRLSLRLFGGFQARIGDRKLSFPTRKSQALLAYLAILPDQGHLRDKLAALLWGGSGREEARHSLRQSLSVLRNALSSTRPPVLRISGPEVALDAALIDVDVLRFEQLIRRDSARSLEEAVALYRGDLLEGLDVSEEPFEEWLLGERTRLRETAVAVLTRFVGLQTESGSDDGAIQTALRLLALDPLREEFHRLLMSLYGRRGRIGDAVQQYQICTAVLRRELGVEPTRETQRVYSSVLSQGRSPLPGPARPGWGVPATIVPAGVPRRGLR